MTYFTTFKKEKQSSSWETESQKFSLKALKDLIDKAMFIADLNTRDTEQVYKLVISDKPFDHQLKLILVNQEYRIVENELFSGHGSFFPELFLLFGSRPDALYIKIEIYKDIKNRKNKEINIDAVIGASKISEDDIRHWINHVSPYE